MGLKIDWVRGFVTVIPPPSREIVAEKALAAAGDYAIEDVLSESATDGVGTPFVFRQVTRQRGGAFSIRKVIALLTTTALAPRITLHLFTKTPTSELDDNAANTAVITADRETYVGRVELPAMSDLGGNSEAIATPDTGSNLALDGVCAGDDDALYGIAVTEDAIAGEAAGMRLMFKLLVRQE